MQPCTLICNSRYDVPFKICGRVAAVLGIIQSLIWLACACVIVFWTPVDEIGSENSTNTTDTGHPNPNARAQRLNIMHIEFNETTPELSELSSSELQKSTGLPVQDLTGVSKAGKTTTGKLKEDNIDGTTNPFIFEEITKEFTTGTNGDGRTIKYDLETDSDTELGNQTKIINNNNLKFPNSENITDKNWVGRSNDKMNKVLEHPFTQGENDDDVIGYLLLINDNKTGSTVYSKLINDSNIPGTFFSKSSFLQSGKNITVIKYFKSTSRTSPQITTSSTDHKNDTMQPKNVKTPFTVKLPPRPASIDPEDIFNEPTKIQKTTTLTELESTLNSISPRKYGEDNDEDLKKQRVGKTDVYEKSSSTRKDDIVLKSSTPYTQRNGEKQFTKQYEVLTYSTEPTSVDLTSVYINSENINNKYSTSVHLHTKITTKQLDHEGTLPDFENHRTISSKSFLDRTYSPRLKFPIKAGGSGRFPGQRERGFPVNNVISKKGVFREYPNRNSKSNETYRTFIYFPTTLVYTFEETDSNFKDFDKDDGINRNTVDVGKHEEEFHPKSPAYRKGIFYEIPDRHSHSNVSYRTLNFIPSTRDYTFQKEDSTRPHLKYTYPKFEKQYNIPPSSTEPTRVSFTPVYIYPKKLNKKMSSSLSASSTENPLLYKRTFPHFIKHTTRKHITSFKGETYRINSTPFKFQKKYDGIDRTTNEKAYPSKSVSTIKGIFQEYPDRHSHSNGRYRTFNFLPTTVSTTRFKQRRTFPRFAKHTTSSKRKPVENERNLDWTVPMQGSYRTKDDGIDRFTVDVGKHGKVYHSKSTPSNKHMFYEYPDRRNSHSNENYRTFNILSTSPYTFGKSVYTTPNLKYMKNDRITPYFQKPSTKKASTAKPKPAQHMFDDFAQDIESYDVMEGYYERPVRSKKRLFLEHPNRKSRSNETYRTFKFFPTTRVYYTAPNFKFLTFKRIFPVYEKYSTMSKRDNENFANEKFSNRTDPIPDDFSTKEVTNGLFTKYPDRLSPDFHNYRTATQFPNTRNFLESDTNSKSFDKPFQNLIKGETVHDIFAQRAVPTVIAFKNKEEDIDQEEVFPKAISSNGLFFEYPERNKSIDENSRTVYNFYGRKSKSKEDYFTGDLQYSKFNKLNIHTTPAASQITFKVFNNSYFSKMRSNQDSIEIFPNEPKTGLDEDVDFVNSQFVETLGKQKSNFRKITRIKRHDTTTSIWDKVSSLVSRKQKAEKKQDKGHKSWVLDFMEKLPPIMSNFTPEINSTTEATSTKSIEFNNSVAIYSALVSNNQENVKTQFETTTIKNNFQAPSTTLLPMSTHVKNTIKNNFQAPSTTLLPMSTHVKNETKDTSMATESTFGNVSEKSTIKSSINVKEKSHRVTAMMTPNYEIEKYVVNRQGPVLFARKNEPPATKPSTSYKSPQMKLFTEHYLKNKFPYLPSFAMCYIPLMLMWFAVSVLLCTMIRFNRLPTPHTRTTVFSYILWSLVTLVVCVLDVIVTIYVIDDGFINLHQTLPAKDATSRVKRNIENKQYKYTDNHNATTASVANAATSSKTRNLDTNKNDPESIAKIDDQNQKHQKEGKYKSQVVRVQMVAVISLFTIRFVIFWLVNLFLAILLFASVCSWRDEWYCNAKCKIIQEQPCWPIYPCVATEPNINYIHPNYPSCVPENPCFQVEPSSDSDYCNDPGLGCKDGRYFPSAPPPNDLNETHKKKISCIYCGETILGSSDVNDSCQKCKKVEGHHHKPCLSCRVDKLPCKHLNATCDGCRGKDYGSRRKTRENIKKRFKAGGNNLGKMYKSRNINNESTTSESNIPDSYHYNDVTALNEEASKRQEINLTTQRPPITFRTYAPCAPNVTFKILRKLFNDDENM